MADTQAPSICALFVDDDAPFLEMVGQLAVELSRGDWQVHLAQDAAAALKILKENPVDLAVLDFYMPTVNGPQLLQSLNRDFPRLPKVFLTGATDETTRVAGMDSGAVLFLEKPGNVAGMESVFATLTELVRLRRKQGERGVPWLVRLLDIVKLECASGNSRLIDVVAGSERGKIFIKAGSIIHAQSEGRRGQSAFTHLASYPNAEFSLRQYSEPPEQSIDRQWEFLVLEAFRLQEQLEQQPPPVDSKEQTVPAATPPSRSKTAATGPPRTGAVTPSPARTPSVPTLDKPLRMAADSQAGRGAVSDETPEVTESTTPASRRGAAQENEAIVVDAGPAAVALALPGDPADFRIEELLICSSQREVLYEWRCSRSEARINLIQSLLDQSIALGRALKLGRFDRVEYLSAQHRLVIQSRGDSSLLVRSNSKGRETPPAAPARGPALDQWLELQLQIKGVVACGVVRPGGASVNRSRSAELTAEALSAAWRYVDASFELTDQNGFSAIVARWIYEQMQLYYLKRFDNASYGLFLNKDPGEVDRETVERSLNEFNSVRAV